MLDIKVNLFEYCKDNFKCERLKALTTFKNIVQPSEKEAEEQSMNVDLRHQLEEDYGLFHNFTPILKPFEECIEWERIENDRYMPRPMKGMDEEIDEILTKMDQIKQ